MGSKEVKKRFDDHEIYIRICDELGIPENRRFPVFGMNQFYDHVLGLKDHPRYKEVKHLALKIIIKQ